MEVATRTILKDFYKKTFSYQCLFALYFFAVFNTYVQLFGSGNEALRIQALYKKFTIASAFTAILMQT